MDTLRSIWKVQGCQSYICQRLEMVKIRCGSGGEVLVFCFNNYYTYFHCLMDKFLFQHIGNYLTLPLLSDSIT